jgi:Na+/phosphate symporter
MEVGTNKEAGYMMDERRIINPFRVLSPQVDAEVLRLKELHRARVSESSALHEGVLIMISKLVEMTKLLSECIFTGDKAKMDDCLTMSGDLEEEERVLTRYLVGSGLSGDMWKGIIRFPYRLKRVGDMLDSIRHCCRIKAEGGIPLSDMAGEEVRKLFALLLEITEALRESFHAPSRENLEGIGANTGKLRHMIDDARQAHWDRLEQGVCAPEASSMYRDILDSMKTADEYLEKMCVSLLQLEEEESD